MLVLAISAPLSEAQKVCSIPSRIFSYAVTLLGRISHALKDVMNQNTLLAYLSHCSKSTIVDNSESFFPMIEGDIPNCSCIDMISPAGMSLQQGASENENQKRSFREELATYMSDSLVSADTLAFTFQYLRVVKLLCQEFLHKEGSIEPYNFVVELKKSLGEIDTYNDGASCRPFLLKRLLESFSLKQFRLSGSPKHIKAEIDLPGNDTEPLPFISGLPVGIPLEITLYNVSRNSHLWHPFTEPKSNVSHFEGMHRNGMFVEDVNLITDCGGPTRELVYICQEKEVYLGMIPW
ncbi:Protein SIEL [Vitis vinifera]|uniref:Protein SIEL n=1 Tax=Vitis vinifera TaxID=29760 RepID=A0A438FV30_VITVI|nr:Protein SIEL [Vitis vinifera]